MGKGDKPRPAAVPDDEVTRRWEKTFGTRCKYADDYKGIHRPRCNVNGKPCDACMAIWRSSKTEHETEVCEIHDRVFPCLPCKIEGGPNADRS
jgi:hypothetical protein